MELNKIYPGDALEVLKTFPANSIDCCITSPPYFGLRDYGQEGQAGLEPTPELYVENMVEVFEQVKRVLKKEGTLWLNLGDSYSGSHGTSTITDDVWASDRRTEKKGNVRTPCGLKQKDLIGIPWMVAFALRQPFYTCKNCSNKTHSMKWGKYPNGRLICPVCALSKGHEISEQGFYLRQDIIWAKPNPMPESVTDRCTKSHEYIFLLSKSSKYYYDADAIKTKVLGTTIYKTPDGWDTEPGSHGTIHRQGREKGYKGYEHRGTGDKKLNGHSGNFGADGNLIGDGFANKRSVWTVTTKPYSEAHFATFPEDLIVDMIKAGCPEEGIVLDPFMGAGTTGLVARKLYRNFIGIELNPAYIDIAEKRLYSHLGMFA